jgi:alpha-glucosidase
MNGCWTKHFLSTCIITVFCIKSLAQQSFVFFSPDSSLHLEIKAGEKLSYTLYAGSLQLESSSSIDLELINGLKLSGNIIVSKHNFTKVNETIAVPVPYRRKKIINHYNELDLSLRSPFSIQFRLYDNGMAYRIGTRFKDSVSIKNETCIFEIDKNAEVWFPHIDKRQGMDRYHTSFEGIYKKEILGSIPDTMLTFAPLTASLPNGYHIAITDANIHDYPGMFLQPSKNGLQGNFAAYPLKEEMTEGEFPQLIVTERAGYIARTTGTRMLPWRAVLVAKNDIDLPGNDMVYALGDPPLISDPSWIKYGKGTDEWISGINLFNVPFVAGINTASYKYYIDFAKRFGFDQIMLDAGWSDYKDLFKLNPNLDMNELSAYAKTKNIRLMLWTLCSTLDRQLDSALTQFNKWGIESIMTDFMDRDDQKMINFYHRTAKACADHKIAIMFHGAYPPKGLNRTWPNVITHEGVLGSEWNIWSELATPEHNVTLAYTRMLAGPFDYEPGILLNAQKDQFRSIGKNPMSQGTRCQQLAMFVCYDSPLQIFSGNISQGLNEPKFMELLGSVPTTWDETKILQGKIGAYIITARQKGNDWFIAGLNGTNAKEISLSLNFIPQGDYKMIICKDGVNANNYGSDYEITEGGFQSSQSLQVKMAKGGGFLISLKKIK